MSLMGSKPAYKDRDPLLFLIINCSRIARKSYSLRIRWRIRSVAKLDFRACAGVCDDLTALITLALETELPIDPGPGRPSR